MAYPSPLSSVDLIMLLSCHAYGVRVVGTIRTQEENAKIPQRTPAENGSLTRLRERKLVELTGGAYEVTDKGKLFIETIKQLSKSYAI